MIRPVLLTLMLLSAGLAAAHDGATGVVRERMEAMKRVARAMKSVAPIVQGRVAYDPRSVQVAARQIADHGGAALAHKFPQGSGGRPSEARPEIWTEPERFAREVARFQAAAQDLADAHGKAEARAAFGRLAQTCKDCHEAFRQRR